MKKLYVLGLVLLATGMAGCTLQGPKGEKTSETIQESTGTVEIAETTTGSTEEIATPMFDSGTVPMVSGSESTDLNNETMLRFKDLVLQRKSKQKDETKLTEDDIGFMEQVIQKVQNIGK